MPNPTTGRHRKPHGSRKARFLAFLLTCIAVTLSTLFVPPTTHRAPPPPVRQHPRPPAPRQNARVRREDPFPPWSPDPDDVAGALIRPYMAGIALPRYRTPEPGGEFAELTARIRDYLALCT